MSADSQAERGDPSIPGVRRCTRSSFRAKYFKSSMKKTSKSFRSEISLSPIQRLPPIILNNPSFSNSSSSRSSTYLSMFVSSLTPGLRWAIISMTTRMPSWDTLGGKEKKLRQNTDTSLLPRRGFFASSTGYKSAGPWSCWVNNNMSTFEVLRRFSGVSFLHNFVGNFLPTNMGTNLSGRRKSY